MAAMIQYAATPLLALLFLTAKAPADHTRDLGELRLSVLSEDSIAALTEPITAKDVYTLGDLHALAELVNPRIRAAALETNAVEGKVRQAMANDNPMLVAEEREISGTGEIFSESTSFVALRQPIPALGRRSAARNLAVAEMNATWHRHESIRNAVLYRVETQWLAELAYRMEIRSVRRHLEILDELARSESGSDFDRRRFALAAEKVALEVTRLTAEQIRNRSELTAELGGLSLDATRITGELPRSINFSLLAISNARIAENAHPVQEARSALLQRHDEETLLRRTIQGDPTIMAGIGRDRAMEETFAEAGVEIPLSFFNRQR